MNDFLKLSVEYSWLSFHGPLAGGYVGAVTETISKGNLAQTAFGTIFGASVGAKFVAICLFFFAFSTVLSWSLFGKINIVYLFGKKNPKLCTTIYYILVLVFVFIGTIAYDDLAWNLQSLGNNLMVLPNVIAMFALTGIVVKISSRHKKGARLEDKAE